MFWVVEMEAFCRLLGKAPRPRPIGLRRVETARCLPARNFLDLSKVQCAGRSNCEANHVLQGCENHISFLKIIYLFIYGCVGSLFLCKGFL